MTPTRVVIIGAGAAGVFTAYRLSQMAPAHEVVLLEASGRVGGNARSIALDLDGATYSIDCGAQFFYRNPQPDYVSLLAELGLFDAPSQIEARATGLTLWDRQTRTPRLWLPAHASGFLRYSAEDWSRLIAFATFLGYAWLLDRESGTGGDRSVDEWIATLALVDSEFKDTVIREFLYQFVTMPADRIGEASARYAITYFVRNVFGEHGVSEPDPDVADPAGAPTFSVYQSLIGLDGVLTRALSAAGVVPRLRDPVTAVRRTIDGRLEVVTPAGASPADHVVFATDPQTAAAILSAGGFPALDLIANLAGCEYSDLQISLQNGAPCWMPEDSSYWESVNTVVDGDDLQFSAWFGPLRKPHHGAPIPVFKSWGSPNVEPAACGRTFFSHSHRVVQPTTTFMARRRDVLTHQGRDGLWFAGGWTTWFDSQEAALDSATEVAARLSGRKLSTSPGPGRIAADRRTEKARITHWLATVGAQAPADLRARLARALDEVESRG